MEVMVEISACKELVGRSYAISVGSFFNILSRFETKERGTVVATLLRQLNKVGVTRSDCHGYPG